jgi:hypothetical protein
MVLLPCKGFNSYFKYSYKSAETRKKSQNSIFAYTNPGSKKPPQNEVAFFYLLHRALCTAHYYLFTTQQLAPSIGSRCQNLL